jgi:predicted transcriptional regulator
VKSVISKSIIVCCLTGRILAHRVCKGKAAEPSPRGLALPESLPRESQGFRMAFQLALLEVRDAVEGGAERCRDLDL